MGIAFFLTGIDCVNNGLFNQIFTIGINNGAKVCARDVGSPGRIPVIRERMQSARTLGRERPDAEGGLPSRRVSSQPTPVYTNIE